MEAAKKYGLGCLILCDTAHNIHRDGAETLVFSKGTDSVDIALVNRVNKGDVVVTQDYGLAAMCLAREALPISQDGMVYTAANIDGLLSARHTAAKIRRSGGRLRGSAKRTQAQDDDFARQLERLISDIRRHNTT